MLRGGRAVRLDVLLTVSSVAPPVLAADQSTLEDLAVDSVTRDSKSPSMLISADTASLGAYARWEVIRLAVECEKLRDHPPADVRAVR